MAVEKSDERSPLLAPQGTINSSQPPAAVYDEDEAPVLDPYWCRCCCFDVFPYIILIGIAQLTLGGYFVYDTPGAIFTQLQKYFGSSYTSSDNLNLYAIYSFPNMILALVGGQLVDRVTGVRFGAILFAGLILVGEVVFCLGVTYKSYYVALFGRFVYGLGGENVTVVQNTYTVRWFRKSGNLALVMGLVVAYSRIGSSLNFVITPYLANKSVQLAVWVGAGVCTLSFLFAIYLAMIDYMGRPRLAKQLAAAEAGEVVSILHIKRFPLPAWFIFMICCFFYIGILSFYTVASDIMQHTGHKFSAERASLFISIPNFVSIVASPLFGRFVDRTGRALYFICIASTVMIGVHIGFLVNALEVTFINPIILMVILGLAYSLGASSLWPIISLIIPPNMQGTAYGLMTSVQNSGLAIAPFAIGYIQDAYSHSRKQYTIPIFIFITVEAVALILTLVLIPLDRKITQGKLNMSASERKALKAQNEKLGLA